MVIQMVLAIEKIAAGRGSCTKLSSIGISIVCVLQGMKRYWFVAMDDGAEPTE